MFAVFGLGPQEILLLVVAGVLLFGRKLPEIAGQVGKALVSFKRTVQGVEEDVTRAVVAAPEVRLPQRVAATAPRFEANP